MGKNAQFKKGYKVSGRYIPLRHDIFYSKAYRSLSCRAKCLLTELHFLEYPNRNGRIGLTEKRAAQSLSCTENTVRKAFVELVSAGFVERMLDGDYKQGMASEYRLTYLHFDGKEPTDEWMYWE